MLVTNQIEIINHAKKLLNTFSWDHLYVYDGTDVFATEIAKLTGNSIPADVTSTGRDVFLNFVSDESKNRNGFKLRFDAGKAKLGIIYLFEK